MAWCEIPASALRTMTWPELWACEEDAVATGDERARRAACDEMRRRREPEPQPAAAVPVPVPVAVVAEIAPPAERVAA